VTSSQGPATSSAATLTVLASGSTFPASVKKFGQTRNDFSGWGGNRGHPQVTRPMVVSALGRFVAPGNTGTHTVKIVNGTTGARIYPALPYRSIWRTARRALFVYRGLGCSGNAGCQPRRNFILSQENRASETCGMTFEATTAVTTTDAVLSGAIYGPSVRLRAWIGWPPVCAGGTSSIAPISVAPAATPLYASQNTAVHPSANPV